VIFFLYRLRDIGTYVTLFAIGHSVTLLYGVLSGTHVNPYLVDAIIGLSVVYKALDNLGAFSRWFGFRPDLKVAVVGIRLLSRVRPGHQASGIQTIPGRTCVEHRRLQRWR